MEITMVVQKTTRKCEFTQLSERIKSIDKCVEGGKSMQHDEIGRIRICIPICLNTDQYLQYYLQYRFLLCTAIQIRKILKA